ncbi:uncharacterized protein LOC134179987 [Corticium candelabrum]|uniref:uncharacterized protein LOC134179987 n=1 Tax=Corticium candelabrum TaxID=121492 RepID=UPI002E25F511|nr:uncharacterized protein LOC134179987 [Corticium candelabrum]
MTTYESARTYFRSQRKRENRKNHSKEDLEKARRRQRLHNKLHRRKAALEASTTYREEDKKEVLEALELELMSLEESESNSTSDCDFEQQGPREQVEKRKRGKAMTTRPIPWRSEQATSIFTSLDRKYGRRQTEQAKRMTLPRHEGAPSKRQRPDKNMPGWAITSDNEF